MSFPSTIRFLSPNGNAATITANGRQYSVAAGGTVDVPFADAIILAANGWPQFEGSGTTAQRPANPHFVQKYLDTTLAVTVVWDGAKWRNPATGVAV
jgi:hypothetical protein